MDYAHWRSGSSTTYRPCSKHQSPAQDAIYIINVFLLYCSQMARQLTLSLTMFLANLRGYYCRSHCLYTTSIPYAYHSVVHSCQYKYTSIYTNVYQHIDNTQCLILFHGPCISRGNATTALENLSLSVLQHVMRSHPNRIGSRSCRVKSGALFLPCTLLYNHTISRWR